MNQITDNVFIYHLLPFQTREETFTTLTLNKNLYTKLINIEAVWKKMVEKIAGGFHQPGIPSKNLFYNYIKGNISQQKLKLDSKLKEGFLISDGILYNCKMNDQEIVITNTKTNSIESYKNSDFKHLDHLRTSNDLSSSHLAVSFKDAIYIYKRDTQELLYSNSGFSRPLLLRLLNDHLVLVESGNLGKIKIIDFIKNEIYFEIADGIYQSHTSSHVVFYRISSPNCTVFDIASKQTILFENLVNLDALHQHAHLVNDQRLMFIKKQNSENAHLLAIRDYHNFNFTDKFEEFTIDLKESSSNEFMVNYHVQGNLFVCVYYCSGSSPLSSDSKIKLYLFDIRRKKLLLEKTIHEKKSEKTIITLENSTNISFIPCDIQFFENKIFLFITGYSEYHIYPSYLTFDFDHPFPHIPNSNQTSNNCNKDKSSFNLVDGMTKLLFLGISKIVNFIRLIFAHLQKAFSFIVNTCHNLAKKAVYSMRKPTHV